MSTTNARTQRFSLLLLEDGEVLLSDFAVQYHFQPDVTSRATQHVPNSYRERLAARSGNNAAQGRIKIGTRNIFFDSLDWRDPIIRIPLVSVEKVQQMRDGSRSQHSDNENVLQTDIFETFDAERSVMLYATSATLQRELGTDHPYIDIQMSGKHIFTPLYLESNKVLDEISILLQITSISYRRDREKRLRELVHKRENEIPFDITLLEYGVEETSVMNTPASAVYALSRAPGRLRITRYNLYFMPIHGQSSQAVQRISVKSIKSLRRLKHGCRDAALEVEYMNQIGTQGSQHEQMATFMISLENRNTREEAIRVLLDIIEQNVRQYSLSELADVQRDWRRGNVSNYDYLMYLNLAAGRSFNDLSQYPVFPWIIQDYTSEKLDLENPLTFRDLSKPVGCLNEKRFEEHFKQRFEMMPHPRFFFGTHYSTPAYTINYLVRAAPAAMLRLQNGKFDTPDRLFNSMASCWDSVLNNRGDLKELIPEFFVTDFSKGDNSGIVPDNSSPGEFLDNVLGLELGIRQDGKRVDDVELPPWANGSSRYFVRRNLDALECEYVSDRLHQWIDLIFGFKSKNEDADNVFYTDVNLPGDIDAIGQANLSESEIEQIELIALEFGMTPTRLFNTPHPPRFGERLTDDSETNSSSGGNELESTPKARTILENVLRDGDGAVVESIMGNRSDSKKSTPRKGGASVSMSKIGTPRRIWGARSRREDSVLKGASLPILVSYEPDSKSGKDGEAQAVPKRQMSNIITNQGTSQNTREIIDMCLVHGNKNSSGSLQNEPAICTIWDDGYLKVHSEQRIMRSKYIGEACSVEYIGRGVVAYGLRSGGIGLYYIDMGRLEIIELGTHDAEVQALAYTPSGGVLVSGSMDASAKIWRVEHTTRSSVSLRLMQELDGESSIDDISVTSERLGGCNGAIHLLVGASTTEGDLMAWEIDVRGERDHFIDPIWRAKVGCSDKHEIEGRKHKLAWLYQGTNRRPALCSVHEEEKCLRVWKLNQKEMAAAEVMLLEDGAKSIVSCDESRTLLVGGLKGRISEFDSTGLCLGSVFVGNEEVGNILLPDGGGRMYVFTGKNEAFWVKR